MSDPRLAGVAVLSFLFICSLAVAIWKIDEHFVTRREFTSTMARLERAINGLSEKLGLPAPFSDHEAR